jgi:predicted transcriptional regulator
MHQIIPQSQLRGRLGKLGLSANDLGLLAGVHHTTITRIMNDQVSPELATMQKITDALLCAERTVLEHLRRLHPEPELGHGEAE